MEEEMKKLEDDAVRKALVLLNRIFKDKEGLLIKPHIIKQVKENWRTVKLNGK